MQSNYYLEPIHNKKVDSFYNQAYVLSESKKNKVLVSSGVKLAEVNGIKCRILSRSFNKVQEMHLREFLRQEHFEVGGLKRDELLEKYR